MPRRSGNLRGTLQLPRDYGRGERHRSPRRNGNLFGDPFGGDRNDGGNDRIGNELGVRAFEGEEQALGGGDFLAGVEADEVSLLVTDGDLLAHQVDRRISFGDDDTSRHAKDAAFVASDTDAGMGVEGDVLQYDVGVEVPSELVVLDDAESSIPPIQITVIKCETIESSLDSGAGRHDNPPCRVTGVSETGEV